MIIILTIMLLLLLLLLLLVIMMMMIVKKTNINLHSYFVKSTLRISETIYSLFIRLYIWPYLQNTMPADSSKTDPALTTPSYPPPPKKKKKKKPGQQIMYLGAAKSTQNQQQYSQYQDYLALETRRLAKRRCQ